MTVGMRFLLAGVVVSAFAGSLALSSTCPSGTSAAVVAESVRKQLEGFQPGTSIPSSMKVSATNILDDDAILETLVSNVWSQNGESNSQSIG